MRSYNRNSRSGGGRYRGGDSRRRDSGRRDMHKAVCDECGNDCEVPFKPSGDKPIYCSNCFEKKGGGSSQRQGRGGPRRSDFGRRDNTNKQLLEQVSSLNAKLDRILKVIEPSVKSKSVINKTKAKKVEKKVTSKKDEKTEVKKVVKKAISKDEKIKVKKKKLASKDEVTDLKKSQ